MLVPEEFFAASGQYKVELDANHNVVKINKKGDPNDYTAPEYLKGTAIDSKTIEIVKTDVPGNTVYCWFRTSTGQYIRVPC